jgi:hypothetical protein
VRIARIKELDTQLLEFRRCQVRATGRLGPRVVAFHDVAGVLCNGGDDMSFTG